jgi:CRP-like cAMP-binding protein
MTENFEVIKSSPLFTGVAKNTLLEIEAAADEEDFKAGGLIINDGEHGDCLYLLKSGEVSVVKKLTMLPQEGEDTKDKELILLRAENRAFFGEMVLCSDTDIRSATVRAQQNSTVLRIKSGDIHAILKKHPECAAVFYRNLSSLLAARLRKSNNDVLKLTTALTLALDEY